jgi:hypothetical protein
LSPVAEGVASRVCSVADVSDLTADGGRQLLLPIVPGSAKNRDLNNVDCHTLAQLITGRYDEEVSGSLSKQYELHTNLLCPGVKCFKMLLFSCLLHCHS